MKKKIKYQKLSHESEALLEVLNEIYLARTKDPLKEEQNTNEEQKLNEKVKTQKIDRLVKNSWGLVREDYEELLKWEYISPRKKDVEIPSRPNHDDFWITPKGLRYARIIRKKEERRNNFILPLISIIISGVSFIIAVVAVAI